jgi:hypothetical protein
MSAKDGLMQDIVASLQAASTPPDLVRVSRGRLPDDTPLRGFVVSASPVLALLHLVSDRIDFDGYAAIRIGDITDVDLAFRKKGFCMKALELKQLVPRTPDGVSLADVPSLVRSVQERYPLVVIHREIAAPDECEIGRIRLASASTYALSLISPEATWVEDGRSYRFEDVTRVGFDGEYENTLALVMRSTEPEDGPR